MTILTFNWHEAYICTLAKTGHQFEVVERFKGGSGVWFYETRPLPRNARIIKESTARRRARERRYDAVVCHNLQDLQWAAELPIPKILVFHNMLTTEIALGGNTVARENHRQEVKQLVDGVDDLRVVFISETKQRDWNLEGTVVLPGIDLADYGGYCGDDPRVLRVGNFMRRRDVMLGHSAQCAILEGRPSTLLGLNEPEEGARFTTGWDDLKDCYRSHRLFLNSTVDGFEDGYNLSMLEAMATGMPVVSTANRTSPIRDGVNGFVSDDIACLTGRVDDLLADRELARTVGVEARTTVAVQFGMERFVAQWNGLFDDCARARSAPRIPSRSTRVARPGTRTTPGDGRKRIVLAYVSFPATAARYLETSLRKIHDVITVGPAIDEGIVRSWNLQNMKEPVRPHDVPTDFDVNAEEMLRRLPAGWEPDLFLWVESVHGYFPSNVQRLDCPTACYLTDSHLNLPWHVEWATRFDHVFVAQRAYRSAFVLAGVPRVDWLPLGCDPDVHGRREIATRYDIGFVGSLTQHHVRRKQLLDRLARRFDVHVERSFLHEMARTMSASKVVFNDAVKDDLNMRVFESLASGAMLLTDRAPGSGLEEMFIDREHLVIYDDSTIEELAGYYLAHDEQRRAIAARGRAEVLRWHTYDHRARTLSDLVFESSHARAVVPSHLSDITDPLVAVAIAHSNERRPAEALLRLDEIDSRRELDHAERLTAGVTRAACLRQLGRHEEAHAVCEGLLAVLPASHRIALQEMV